MRSMARSVLFGIITSFSISSAPPSMPDVATRRVELLARFERFADQRQRSRDHQQSGEQRAGVQWWRSVASRPMPEPAR